MTTVTRTLGSEDAKLSVCSSSPAAHREVREPGVQIIAEEDLSWCGHEQAGWEAEAEDGGNDRDN